MTNVFDKVYSEDEEIDAVEIASQTMMGDLVRAVLDELKAAPDVWQKLSEAKQGECIDRLECRVAECVEQVVHIIASADRPTIRARLEQLTTKDAVKAVCVVSRKDEGVHELMDAVSEEVLIVLPHAEQYTEQPTGLEPDPDQPGLALTDDDNKDPLLDEAIQIARNDGRCSISKIQRGLRIGYNRSARLVETMERLGVVSPMNEAGGRDVYPSGQEYGEAKGGGES